MTAARSGTEHGQEAQEEAENQGDEQEEGGQSGKAPVGKEDETSGEKNKKSREEDGPQIKDEGHRQDSVATKNSEEGDD